MLMLPSSPIDFLSQSWMGRCPSLSTTSEPSPESVNQAALVFAGGECISSMSCKAVIVLHNAVASRLVAALCPFKRKSVG